MQKVTITIYDEQVNASTEIVAKVKVDCDPPLPDDHDGSSPSIALAKSLFAHMQELCSDDGKQVAE